jgi:protein TonB
MKKILFILFVLNASFCFSQQKDTILGVGHLETGSDEIIVPDKKESKKEVVFSIVEQMPEFPGGMAEMMKFIQKNIRYPKKDKKNGISGTCYVTFIIDKTGEIREAKILRGINGGERCNSEALRVVKSMPKWIPGKQNGKNVDVQFNLPIKFTITDKKSK